MEQTLIQNLREQITSRDDAIRERDEIIREMASLNAHLQKQCKRAGVKRPKVSATQSIWIAGRQQFKCACDDRSKCPLFIIGDGRFTELGWEIDHIAPWSDAFDHRDASLRALCSTCHTRTTKLQMIERFNQDPETDEVVE